MKQRAHFALRFAGNASFAGAIPPPSTSVAPTPLHAPAAGIGTRSCSDLEAGIQRNGEGGARGAAEILAQGFVSGDDTDQIPHRRQVIDAENRKSPCWVWLRVFCEKWPDDQLIRATMSYIKALPKHMPASLKYPLAAGTDQYMFKPFP